MCIRLGPRIPINVSYPRGDGIPYHTSRVSNYVVILYGTLASLMTAFSAVFDRDELSGNQKPDRETDNLMQHKALSMNLHRYPFDLPIYLRVFDF